MSVEKRSCVICEKQFKPPWPNVVACSESCRKARRMQLAAARISRPCKLDGCNKDIRKGGWGYCAMHYRRVKVDGDPGTVEPSRFPLMDPYQRILQRVVVDPETDCWEWQGARLKGYGLFGVGPKLYYTHRYTYTHDKGPIQKGMVIDHLCVNPACCNPEHLEVVTRAENNRRGGRLQGARSKGEA